MGGVVFVDMAAARDNFLCPGQHMVQMIMSHMTCPKQERHPPIRWQEEQITKSSIWCLPGSVLAALQATIQALSEWPPEHTCQEV